MALTFAHADDVVLLGQQLRQALHQQQSLVVALRRRLPLVEHLIQRGRLHLRTQQQQQDVRTLVLSKQMHTNKSFS